MNAEALLEHLTIGDVETYQNLSFVRVFGDDKFSEDVLLLNEAFSRDGFTASESGNVPIVLIRNGLERMVFIATGMILEGKSQNRASQYPAIIPAYSREIAVPVRCAEHGQGLLPKGTRFERSGTIIAASARSGEVGQDRTWGTVTRLSQSFDTSSRTENYVSVVKGAELEEFVAALGEPKPAQVGYIAAIKNGQVSFYADVFGSHGLYTSLYKMLHESIAATAKHVSKVSRSRGGEQSHSETSRNTFVNFLQAAREAELTPVDSNAESPSVLYVLKEPIEGSVLSRDGTAVQTSLRKDVYQGEQRNSVGGIDQTMIFRPQDLKE